MAVVSWLNVDVARPGSTSVVGLLMALSLRFEGVYRSALQQQAHNQNR